MTGTISDVAAQAILDICQLWVTGAPIFVNMSVGAPLNGGCAEHVAVGTTMEEKWLLVLRSPNWYVTS